MSTTKKISRISNPFKWVEETTMLSWLNISKRGFARHTKGESFTISCLGAKKYYLTSEIDALIERSIAVKKVA